MRSNDLEGLREVLRTGAIRHWLASLRQQLRLECSKRGRRRKAVKEDEGPPLRADWALRALEGADTAELRAWDELPRLSM